MIKNKVQKIIESFGAKKYELPASSSDYQLKIKHLENEQEYILETLRLTKTSIEYKLN